MFGQHVASHLLRATPVHHPQREADVVPAQVAQATQRLQLAVGADVAWQRTPRRPPNVNCEAIRFSGPTVWPSSRTSRMRSSRRLCMNITPSMNCTPLRRQAARISRTSCGSGPDRFFHQHVFSRFRRADRPTVCGSPVGKGKYTASTVVAGQQLFVAAASAAAEESNGACRWHSVNESSARARDRGWRRPSTCSSARCGSPASSCARYPPCRRMPQRQTFLSMLLYLTPRFRGGG